MKSKKRKLFILFTLVFLVGAVLPAAAQTPVSSRDAALYDGQQATVCGTIAGTHQSTRQEARPFYINFDAVYPHDPFFAIIWGDDRAKFTGQTFAAGQPLCVTGPVGLSKRNAKPFITLTDPGQIDTTLHVIRASDAVLYQGSFIAMTGRVASAHYDAAGAGKRTYLNLDAAYPNDPAMIVILPGDRERFGQPEKDLLGKTVTVRGIVVRSEKGRAVIILSWPSQLSVGG